MSVVAFGFLVEFILIFAVLMVVGRIVIVFLSRPHATMLNAFLFAVGTLAGAWVFTILVFVIVIVVLRLSLTPDNESTLSKFSMLIGAFGGGTAVIWLRLRKKSEPKQKAPGLAERPQEKK